MITKIGKITQRVSFIDSWGVKNVCSTPCPTSPQTSGHNLQTIPNLPLFSGHVKVSFLTPEETISMWDMGW
jgi:hypothetical protein